MPDGSLRTFPTPRAPHRSRARRSFAVVLAMLAGALVATAPQSATAAQAPGDDVVAWSNGWSWTYATSFRYVGDGTDVTINENVTYTVAGSTTFQGQDAYQLNIAGNITGGGGSTQVEGFGNVTLNQFSGSVSGTRIVRKSDLALLRESQQQSLRANAAVLFGVAVDADIDLQLTPDPGWRTRNFPLNAGDTWQNAETITYEGGFSYSSSVASGSSPIDGSFDFNGASSVTNESINVPAGNGIATKKVHAEAATEDGTAINDIWWSPARKNDAKELLVLPLDGATLTINRNLSASSTPAPSTSLTATATPSLTCAGGEVTVSGKLGSAAGVPVSVYLDKAPINPSQRINANTTTGANGTFTTTLTAPIESDGLSKNGSRGNWGIYVSGGGANAATTLVVTPKDCTTLEYTGSTTAPRGTDAVVSAKLTNLGGGSAAGRTITFSLDGGASVDATTNGSGIATASLHVGETARSTTVRTAFAGTSTTEAAQDSAPFVVGKVATGTSVAPSLPSVEISEPVTFTADVTPALSGLGPADGTVQFLVDGTNFGAAVPLTGGTAVSAPFSTTVVGDHTVRAVYSGSAGFLSSVSPDVIFEVTPPRAPTTTTSAASPTAAVFGQNVTLSADVAAAGGGVPTGSVTFKRGSTVIGTAPLDAAGEATLDTTALPVGTSSIVATYSGDDTFKSSSSSPQSVVVAKAAVTVDLTSSGSPTVTGEAVDFTASVAPVAPGAGVPSGSVQLQVDGTDVGAPVALSGGIAAFDAITSLTAGAHTVRAVYTGDAGFQGGADTISQDVAKADTSTVAVTSPSVSNEGAPFTITASVVADAPGSGTPTGNVTFSADGDTIGAAAVTGDGTASISVDTLAPGDRTIVATYAGNADYNGSTSEAVTHVVVEGAAVVATTTELASSANPTTYGTLISFTATVEAEDDSTPSGAVQFSVDGTAIGGPVAVVDGAATSVLLAAPDPGDHSVIAVFQPDAGFSGSGDFLTQTVEDASVELTLDSSDASSDFGQTVRFTADVVSAQAGTLDPTGYVQFRVDGLPLGDAVEIEDGVAVSPDVSDLTPGDHQVTALYSGDIRFSSAETTLTQQVAKIGTTTELEVSPTSSTFGDPVQLTATITPATTSSGPPAGSVTFTDGSTVLATVPVEADGSTATASIERSDLDAGAHAITAEYSGSTLFAAGTSATKDLQIAKRSTSMTAEPAVVKLLPLGLPLGQLQASVGSSLGPVAGVPVVFTIGGVTAGTATTDVNGVAKLNASSRLLQLILAGGYTATFDGSPNFVGSSANGVILR